MSSKSLHLHSLAVAGSGAGAACMLSSVAQPAVAPDRAKNMGKEGRMQRGMGARMGRGADSSARNYPQGWSLHGTQHQEGRGRQRPGCKEPYPDVVLPVMSLLELLRRIGKSL